MGTMTDQALGEALDARTAPRVTKEEIEAAIARVDYHVLPGNDASPGERVTICQITLQNGFDVRGESACVDPRNFDPEIGQHYAHEDAFKKLWPFFGFMLAEQLHQKVLTPAVIDQSSSYRDLPPHMQRVAIERDELSDRLDKLQVFIGGATFLGLPADAQLDLVDQQSHMCAYLARLNIRLGR